MAPLTPHEGMEVLVGFIHYWKEATHCPPLRPGWGGALFLTWSPGHQGVMQASA